jgi:hypothetical protein
MQGEVASLQWNCKQECDQIRPNSSIRGHILLADITYPKTRVFTAGLLSGMQHPEDVEDHDESWHYETSEDHVLFHESMVQPQKASYDNQTDSHVPTGPSAFLLQQWNYSC